jgi:hypothetical protein
MLLFKTPKTQSIQLYKKISYQTFNKRNSEYRIYFRMREIKHRFFIDISVESVDNKEDLPIPKFHYKEPVQSDTKKITIDSTVTKKFEKSDSPNLDSVVGGDMKLA